jgi:hypothetical protein
MILDYVLKVEKFVQSVLMDHNWEGLCDHSKW